MPVREIGWIEPTQAFAALAAAPGLVFLDSAAAGDKRSACSYICLEPASILRLAPAEDTPFEKLRGFLAAHRRAPPPNWPFAFKGGAVGWLGYDAGARAAGLHSRFAPLPGLPGGWFGLYETVIGFDHAAQRAFVLAADPAALAARLRPAASGAVQRPAWRQEMPYAVYATRLARLRAYIAAGDVYQANLTMRFAAPRPAAFNAPAFYLALRRLSPAPFAAFMACGESVAVISASPERFLSVSAQGHVESRPIKGTAARRADEQDDAAAAAALLASPKERAENLMIVDLLRNDLGQVCETGSIAVPELFALERFAQAHHLVSAVTGRLRPGADVLALLAASFPGGSITGAPKLRAMQIIDELESGPRGAYCGAMMWIGFDGAMDSAIIIRTVVATAATLYAQAGGGITWDSDAAAEYEEAMTKIAPLLEAGCV